MVEVEIVDVETKGIEEDIINRVVVTVLKEEGIKHDVNVFVMLTNNDEIHIINKEQRNVDRPTDVLSFPMFEKEEIDNIIKNKEVQLVPEALGDIVISVEQVEIQAKEYGHSFERELSYMLVHGFYHIMGYDHIEEEDKVQMRKKEEVILEKLKQTR